MRAKANLLLRGALVAATLALSAGPALASLERARAAQARGDLRAAQIELRNAVRAAPADASLRMELARASLDLGEAEVAEREAREALNRGFDRAPATTLLVRTLLANNRAREVLREFPEPPAGTEPAVAAAVLSGRAQAQLALDQPEEARRSAEAAVAAAPRLPDPLVILAAVHLRTGDNPGAEATIDRALALDPAFGPALQQKAIFHFSRGEMPAAIAMLGRVIAATPTNVMARLQRAEALMRTGEVPPARADVDAALRLQPGNVMGNYMRAVLQARAREWRAADETLARLGQLLPNMPEGLLLLATVKRELGQTAQALDAIQRHVARNPEEPRGARLLAQFELEAGRPAGAAAVLNNLVRRTGGDAESLDMLGLIEMAANRPREAAEAWRRASEMAPGNAVLLQRLAAARLSVGDFAGMAESAQQALARDPQGPAARMLLAMAAVANGDLVTAEAELARVEPTARTTEPVRILHGTIALIRFQTAEARRIFEGVLADNRESVPARLGLARVAATEARPEEAERLLVEVLRRDTSNQEAIGRLAGAAVVRGARSQTALAALEAAQAANPRDAGLAVALSNVYAGIGEPARAAQLLQSDAVRAQPGNAAAVQMRLSELAAAREDWPAAEAAARAAMAEDPGFSPARRQLALLLNRRGETRAAEALLEDGLRINAADTVIQGATVALAQAAGGVDAALAAVDAIQRRPGAMPAAAGLRGEVLLAAGRPREAAEAFAAAQRTAPTAALLLRQASAVAIGGNLPEAAVLLRDWVRRNPNDLAVLANLAQVELQLGRSAEAEQLYRLVVQRNPRDAVALNNLAWLRQERGGEAERTEALLLAERAFFLAPTAEIADTLGWILARSGQAPRAVPLLRQAAAAAAGGNSPQAAGIAYRLAYALNLAGERAEAQRVLEPVLAATPAFAERAEAERLLARLRGG